MFGYMSVVTWMIRFAIFMLLFSTYPLLNLFVRTHLLNLFFEKKEIRKYDLVILNLLMTLIPLAFAIFDSATGSIIAFSGATAGFIIIYCLPVMVYLKAEYLKVTNPALAEAIKTNQFRVVLGNNDTKDGLNSAITDSGNNSILMSTRSNRFQNLADSSKKSQETGNSSRKMSCVESLEEKKDKGIPVKEHPRLNLTTLPNETVV